MSSSVLQWFTRADMLLMMSDEQARADVDRLLGHLLPIGHRDRRFRYPQAAYAAAIDRAGALMEIRSSRWVSAWLDDASLAARLDGLVAEDAVRAVGVCARVMSHDSDGLRDDAYPAIHMRIEHRALFSTDFVMPFEWGPVHKAGTPQPFTMDRVATGRPYRAWPGSTGPDPRGSFAPVPPNTFSAYMARGPYRDVLRVLDVAEHAYQSLQPDDPGIADAADRLATARAALFRHSGHTHELELAIQLSRQAVARIPPDALHRAHLADHLGLRFLETRQLADLERAVAEARAAIAQASEPTERLEVGEILAALLLTQYRTTAERSVLREAFAALGRVNDRPTSEPPNSVAGRKWASTLATGCLASFERDGQTDALDSAHDIAGWALRATDEDDPELPRRLRALGVAKLRLFELTNDDDHLEGAYGLLDSALTRLHES